MGAGDIAQLVKRLPGMHEALDSISRPRLDMVVQAYNPSTLGVRAGESEVQLRSSRSYLVI